MQFTLRSTASMPAVIRTAIVCQYPRPGIRPTFTELLSSLNSLLVLIILITVWKNSSEINQPVTFTDFSLPAL